MAPTAVVPHTDDPVVVAHDASYRRGTYRSFEFATFEARRGEVTALVARDHAPERDMLLAIAGLVRPTEGSLVVDGTELARRAGGAAAGLRARRASLAPGTARVGIFAGVADVEERLTVEEAVAHEFSFARARGAKVDVLEYLASFGLATHVDQRVSQLPARACAQLSAALACAGDPAVTLVDLADSRLATLDVSDAVELVRTWQAVARDRGVALVVGATEPQVAAAASRAFALDLDAAAALSAQGASAIASPLEEVSHS